MFDVESQEGGRVLGNAAVFTVMTSAFAHKLTKGLVHQAAPERLSSRSRASICSSVTNCAKLTYCSY